MSTQTTPAQIDSLKQMCLELPGAVVRDARVDDWGRFGNFTVFVTPQCHNPSTTVKLRAAVRKALPRGARIRDAFPPDPIREFNRYTRQTKVVGYSRTFWCFDIDFQKYDFLSNSFS